MKIKLLFLFLVISPFLHAQNQSFEGKRIVMGSFNLQASLVKNNSNIDNFGASILTGKVKKNNKYTNYGFGVAAINNSGTEKLVFVGPMVGFGKIVDMGNKLYWSPNITSSAQFLFKSNNSMRFLLGSTFNPLNFIYGLNEKFYLKAGFGSVTANVGSGFIDINANVNNSSDFGVFYLF